MIAARGRGGIASASRVARPSSRNAAAFGRDSCGCARIVRFVGGRVRAWGDGGGGDLVGFRAEQIQLGDRPYAQLQLQRTVNTSSDGIPTQQSDEVATAAFYQATIVSGRFTGRDVLIKVYPALDAEIDALAANEIASHCALQASGGSEDSIAQLVGGFESEDGAKCLVFEPSGIYDAAYWLAQASKTNRGLGAPASASKPKANNLLGWLGGPDLDVNRRQAFALTVIRRVLEAVAFMHENDRLHQCIGPSSVVLNTPREYELGSLDVRLRDLCFSVDVSDAALRGGATLAELWEAGEASGGSGGRAGSTTLASEAELWRRARLDGGCTTHFQQRNYGIADDVFQAGLLALTVVFVALSDADTFPIEEGALVRLVTLTFAGDFGGGFREYVREDPKCAGAVAWLDEHRGWELLGAMLDADWRKRPTAASCLVHPFITQPLKY